MTSNVVPVVAACVVHCDLVLLSERLTTREPSILGKWEFPGGTVHSGERFEDALEREIREELGLHIKVGNLLHAQINTYDSGTDYLVLYYKCDLVGEVEYFAGNLRWVHPQSIVEDEWDVLPGTVEAAKTLSEVRK